MKKTLLLLLSFVFLYAAQPKFLMPEEAFKTSATLNEKSQIEAKVTLAKDIYIYEDSIKLELKDASGIYIKEKKLPTAIDHDGDMVYHTSPTFIIELKKDASASGIKEVEFKLSYQGCSEQGLCYEPYTDSFKLSVDTSKLASSKASSKEQKELKTLKKAPQKELSETDSIANTIKSGSLIVILLTFFGFGILLSLTPCVFPMIPIISGVIISQGEGLTTKKAFFLSIVYVLAMAVAYTIAGVLAGLFGSNLQAALQTPWVIYSFAGVFVALAMSMFGFYELKLPDSLVAKVSSDSNRSGVVGVAIMGFLSALIVGPCVAAPLAGALVYIGQTGDAVLGGAALFSMSIGMGLPLIAVGVSAGKFMPKPGAWMTMVSAIFGVMMLGVAIWMLERVVEPYVTMLLFAVLGIGFGTYLGAFEKEAHIFRKSVAIIIFIYSVSLFLGALGGSTSMTKPLSFLQSTQVISAESKSQKHLEFQKVKSLDELDALLAKNKGKKILIDFSAEWCTACKEMEEITFADAGVKAKMSEYVLINADVTENTKAQKAMSKKYGVFGPPVVIFIDESGEILSSKTVVGFMEPEEFIQHF
jgi:thiol:disulfide interchange protein DsbD